MNILEQIIANKKTEVSFNKTHHPVNQLQESANFRRSCFSLASNLKNTAGIIAEFKRRSPSKGVIRQDASVKEITKAYQHYGASACSILTDQHYFQGDNKDITSVRSSLNIPILRKDFIIDPYQIIEAKSIGADLILLIAECLTKQQIKDFTAQAHDLGLEVLMELHEVEELEKWNPEIDLLGINNRDLKNFHTGIEKSLTIAPALPVETIWISESGLQGQDELQQLLSVGYRGFLIGETFMRSDEPGKMCGQFVNSLSLVQPYEK